LAVKVAKQKPMPPTGRLLFEPVKAACRFSPEVVVSFSGGKDSVVVLDMCVRHFKKVHVFFMYQVPGLSFQEATLRWYENKYGLEIIRLPHPELSEFLRYGLFRHHDLSVPLVTFNELYHYVRLQTGQRWIAAGERIADSIVRRAMMKKSGSIDVPRGRFYPAAYFRKEDVVRYVAQHQLKVSPESRFLGHSFRSFDPEDMYKVRKHYPEDYAKIERFFPFVGAGVEKFIRECEESGEQLP
jgi:phosphoadenosine phosphosulfate reductase